MFLYIVYLTALIISCISGWFSVAGMVAVFAGNPVGAIAFSSSLEVGKLVCASWLYRHWFDAPKKLKIPFMYFTVVLICLTSIGIFGYLSKAHLDQGAPVVDHPEQIQNLEDKIANEKRRITDAQTVINQLDDQVNKLVAADRVRGKNGSIALRNSQKPERKELSEEINNAQNNIDSYTEKRTSLSSELKKVELEVGPIKYLAQLIYGDKQKQLDKVVQILILVIVSVFDPLAVLLLIAANHTQRIIREKKENLLEKQNSTKDNKAGNSKKGSISQRPKKKIQMEKDIKRDSDKIEIPTAEISPEEIHTESSGSDGSNVIDVGNSEEDKISTDITDTPNIMDAWTSPKHR